jgi:NAD(P)-dependent dehydrogenase (short-subunit alcohol dehydrogenase family)
LDLQLAGKHVLVAGGSRGIGYECAKEFLAEGCRVTLLGRNAERLEEARLGLDAGEGRVRGIATDLTDWAKAKCAIDQAEADGGGIDILINTAGAAKRKPFAELEPADWRAAMESKFLTYINVMDPVIKRMAIRGSGSVVNIIGMGGKVPITTHLAGGSANAALMMATASYISGAIISMDGAARPMVV